jgi:putative oxidoreductase
MDLASVPPLTILRVLCGIWFLPHCIGKASNIEASSVTFDKAGMRPARFFVVLTVILEIVAGLGLVLNIQPRLAAVLAMAVLLGASYAVIKIDGFNWRWKNKGPEFMVFWAIACALSVSG